MKNNQILFYQQEKYFWQAICHSTIDIDESTITYFSELPIPAFNFIYLHQNASIASFELAEDLFKQQNKPYILVIQDSELEKFKFVVTQRELIDDGESTAMILDHSNLSDHAKGISLPNGYHITVCNQDLTSWAEPLITAFPISPEDDEAGDDTVINEYIRYHQRALDKKINMLHFVLFHNQQPTSTLTLTLNNKIARLDDIGTDAQYQRRGLATLLIKHALQVCHQQGIEQCVLEASSDGLGIYQKLGFKPIFNYHSFVSA
ncbi:MAG TPA: N-acetyltransferase [Providencia sp.]|uniref:GNAT family N-acetyltransferase n=1 Tax=Providencia sp. TaxID=589 RepID=UPI000E99168D|nr:GNAT family N-acetyltransferase [Providencia sp.]MBP6081939.1 GNAT family N-acetyltransferase [Providencia sp.]HBO21981.1 N-acetyltransferase [Providencia sp.]